jgi:hypothetical protein
MWFEMLCMAQLTENDKVMIKKISQHIEKVSNHGHA